MRYIFAWDPRKAKDNLRQHRISFERAATVFRDPQARSLFDADHSHDEDRWVTLGVDRGGSVLVVVHTLDIIANKFLRLPAVNSKVVQSTGDLHHKIVILFFRISENVFDNATSFNSRNDMLNHNPDT